jgi:Flp pilus assembly protein TadD
MAATVLAFLSSFVIAPVSDRSEANIHYNIGRLLLDRGQNEAAVAEFDQALAGWPTHFMALINRGNALDALGRTEDALASYRRSEEIKPNFWTAYKNAGLLLYRARRYEEAEATFRRGLAAGESEARYLLAVVLQQEQREDEAVEMLQDALRMNPRESRAHTRLGEILAKRGDAEGARAHFRQALAVNPSDTSARDGLARLGG